MFSSLNKRADVAWMQLLNIGFKEIVEGANRSEKIKGDL